MPAHANAGVGRTPMTGKFKVGDEVIIRCLSSLSDGKSGTIKEKVDTSINGWDWRVLHDNSACYIGGTEPFREDDLELVKPQPKFKKGDRVEYVGNGAKKVKTGTISSITPDQIDVLFDGGELTSYQTCYNFNFRLIDHEYSVGDWVEVVVDDVGCVCNRGGHIRVVEVDNGTDSPVRCDDGNGFLFWMNAKDIKPLPAGKTVVGYNPVVKAIPASVGGAFSDYDHSDGEDAWNGNYHDWRTIFIGKKQTKSKGFKMAYFKVKDFLGIGADKKAVMETILTEDGQLNTCSPVLVKFFLEEFGDNLKLVKLAKAEMAKRKGETRCQ